MENYHTNSKSVSSRKGAKNKKSTVKKVVRKKTTVIKTIVKRAREKRGAVKKPKGKKLFKINTAHCESVTIGFDTEYVPNKEKGSELRKSDLVSYQLYGIGNKNKREWSMFIPLEKGAKRWPFKKLIRKILIKGMKEKCMSNWPHSVRLAIHWTLADLPMMSDFKELRQLFDNVQRKFISLQEPVVVHFSDENNNSHIVEVNLFDTMLLAPNGMKALDKIGGLLGYEKHDVAQEDKEDMRAYYEREPALFEKYGLRDAEICAKYLDRVAEISSEMTDNAVCPISIGSMATNFAVHCWQEHGFDELGILGQEMYKPERGRPHRIPLRIRDRFDQTAIESYHGGRNETYFFGATPEGNYYDWDLCGAYTNALQSIGMPRWKELTPIRDLNGIALDKMGAALVEFEFPEGTRFPCLPVRGDTALIFPRTGESYASFPEIDLAQRMGAKLKLIHGYELPMDMDKKPFHHVSKTVADKRAEFKKQFGPKSLMELMYKETGNSVYGKLAQGLRPKRVFDTREGSMKELPPSRITNPYLAGHVTGLVRAVLSEILWMLPDDCLVVSATTDGFLSDATREVVMKAASGKLGTYFADLRQEVTGKREVLECKGEVKQVLAWRTRGQASLKYDEENYPILARAGIQFKTWDVHEQNQLIIKKFVNRKHGEKVNFERFASIRKLYDMEGDWDLVKYDVNIAYGMDYDWKRVPTQTGERVVLKENMLWFTSKPIESLEQYVNYRLAWKNFAKESGRVLKTPQDLDDFKGYMAVPSGLNMRRKRTPGIDASEEMVKRCFLMAYVNEHWGLERKLTNKSLADKLTNLGYETSREDVENAFRKKEEPQPCLVAVTERAGKLLDVMEKEFPAFDRQRVLVQDGPEAGEGSQASSGTRENSAKS